MNNWWRGMVAAWLLTFGVGCPLALWIEHMLGMW